MTKTILITGATDGIGFELAKRLAAQGCTLLLHGRSESKLVSTQQQLSTVNGVGDLETYCADLSSMSEVTRVANEVISRHKHLHGLINNAGVFKIPSPYTAEGLDLRFLVNTVAPYLLTNLLLPILTAQSRVINLSSAAQASVDLDALGGRRLLADSDAYAQSKLAITMWTFHMAQAGRQDWPAFIAVNPASFLASKMVKDAYGREGNDLGIGADILFRAALSDEFSDASGQYYDNDRRQFSPPHPDALDAGKNRQLVEAMDALLSAQGN